MLRGGVCRRPLGCAFCFLGAWLLAAPAYAQSVYTGPDAGALSRTIEDDLMQFERLMGKGRALERIEAEDSEILPQTPQADAPIMARDDQKVVPVWSMYRAVPDENVLGSAIGSIFVEAPRLNRDIKALATAALGEKSEVGQQDIINLRRDVWNLYLQSGRLAYVSVRVVPQEIENRPSFLMIKVDEVSVRHILVEGPEGESLPEGVRAGLVRDVEKALAEGHIINLSGMDAQIQHRLRLGDYVLRLGLAPVTSRQMDVKVIVSKYPDAPARYHVQYDNSGMRSFGRDRFMAMATVGQVMAPGDDLNVLLLKTGDLARRAMDSGVIYGRLGYEMPVAALGVRLGGWASAMRYDAVKGVTANSEAQGESYEVGARVARPLWTGKESLLDGRVDVVMKHQVDRFDSNTVLAKKAAYLVRASIQHQQKLDHNQHMQAELGLAGGVFDLSGNRSSYEQDKAGAKAHGPFGKMTASLMWNRYPGAADRFDFSGAMRAQAAIKNLDSMEKLSLGGESGLRGFGSGEAMGDHGVIAQLDGGYRLQSWLRVGAFYDVGWTQRYANSFNDDGIPLSYMLQNAGVSLTAAYQGVQLKTSFAHQIGRNHGLTHDGRDSENMKQAYRLWLSLSAGF